MRRLVAVFHSTREVMRANRACMKNGVTCKVIPVPRQFSSDCGMALDIDPEREEYIREVLEQEMLVAAFHYIDE